MEKKVIIERIVSHPSPTLQGQYRYSDTNSRSRSPVILSHYRLRPSVTISNKNMIVRANPPFTNAFVKDNSDIHLPSTSTASPHTMFNQQGHQVVVENHRNPTNSCNQTARILKRPCVRNPVDMYSTMASARTTSKTTTPRRSTSHGGGSKLKSPKGTKVGSTKKTPIKVYGSQKVPNMTNTNPKKEFSVSNTIGEQPVKAAYPAKPIFITTLRKNLLACDEDSKKKISSVANFLEKDTSEKGLEVLDSLDDASLTVLVSKVMDVINKMYGDYLAEALMTHLGAEKYEQIAHQGLTTFSEFLAQRPSTANEEQPEGNSQATANVLANAVRSASARTSLHFSKTKKFVKLNTRALLLSEAIGKPSSQSGPVQPKLLEVPDKRSGNSVVEVQNVSVGGDGNLLGSSSFAEADKFISDQIDSLRKQESLEDNFTFKQSQNSKSPPIEIFEVADEAIKNVQTPKRVVKKTPKAMKRSRPKNDDNFKFDPLLSKPSASFLEVKSVISSSPDLSSYETRDHESESMKKLEEFLSPILPSPEQGGSVLGLTKTPEKSEISNSSLGSPMSRNSGSDFLGFTSPERQDSKKMACLLARMEGNAMDPKISAIDEAVKINEALRPAKENRNEMDIFPFQTASASVNTGADVIEEETEEIDVETATGLLEVKTIQIKEENSILKAAIQGKSLTKTYIKSVNSAAKEITHKNNNFESDKVAKLAKFDDEPEKQTNTMDDSPIGATLEISEEILTPENNRKVDRDPKAVENVPVTSQTIENMKESDGAKHMLPKEKELIDIDAKEDGIFIENKDGTLHSHEDHRNELVQKSFHGESAVTSNSERQAHSHATPADAKQSNEQVIDNSDLTDKQEAIIVDEAFTDVASADAITEKMNEQEVIVDEAFTEVASADAITEKMNEQEVIVDEASTEVASADAITEKMNEQEAVVDEAFTEVASTDAITEKMTEQEVIVDEAFTEVASADAITEKMNEQEVIVDEVQEVTSTAALYETESKPESSEIRDDAENALTDSKTDEKGAAISESVNPTLSDAADTELNEFSIVSSNNMENKVISENKVEAVEPDQELKKPVENLKADRPIVEAIPENLTTNNSKDRHSPDIEQSMNDLAQLLIQFQASGSSTAHNLPACEPGFSNESFESFAQTISVGLKDDRNDVEMNNNEIERENSADDLAALLVEFQESSQTDLSERCRLEAAEQIEDDECPLVEVESSILDATEDNVNGSSGKVIIPRISKHSNEGDDNKKIVVSPRRTRSKDASLKKVAPFVANPSSNNEFIKAAIKSIRVEEKGNEFDQEKDTKGSVNEEEQNQSVLDSTLTTRKIDGKKVSNEISSKSGIHCENEDCIFVSETKGNASLRQTGARKWEDNRRRKRKLKQCDRNLLRNKIAHLSKMIRSRIENIRKTCNRFNALVTLNNMVIHDRSLDNTVLRQKVQNLDAMFTLVNKVFMPFKDTDIRNLRTKFRRLRMARQCSSPVVIKKPEKHISIKKANIKKAGNELEIDNSYQLWSDPKPEQGEIMVVKPELNENNVLMKPMKTYSRAHRKVFHTKSDSNIEVNRKLPNKVCFRTKSEGFEELKRSMFGRNGSSNDSGKSGSGILQYFVYEGKQPKETSPNPNPTENGANPPPPEMVVVKQEFPLFGDERDAVDPLRKARKRKRINKEAHESKPLRPELVLIKEELIANEEEGNVDRLLRGQKLKKEVDQSTDRKPDTSSNKRVSATRRKEKAIPSRPVKLKEVREKSHSSTLSKKVRPDEKQEKNRPQTRRRENGVPGNGFYKLRKRQTGNNA